MKKAKFLVSHFDAGTEKYKAGEAYDLTDETRLCIVRGAAEEVEVEDKPADDKDGADAEARAKAEAAAADKEAADNKAVAGKGEGAAKAKK